MDRHVDAGHQCGTVEGQRKVFQIQFDRFAQIRDRLLDGLALTDRSRFGVKRDLATFVGRGKDCGYLHDAYLSPITLPRRPLQRHPHQLIQPRTLAQFLDCPRHGHSCDLRFEAQVLQCRDRIGAG